ncbi:GGDEF domain-containing protein [Marinitoga sp. 38H-ov]|uniref:GGDEF domain-containing protein n=1 Tax=Marinitoga sp. 38H-ov TaxID=1755814 RepID=UPI0013EC51D2|nr:GGDEF domain-containing protein [Marinitoga sp. 38H-ov]KAF2955144.1 hypothetical protein AS160_02060 [Marinitoga sp. 38H-ov]
MKKIFDYQMTVSIILSILLLIFFPITFEFQLKNIIIIFLLTFISDNIVVKWKNKDRLVSNLPGFIVAYLFGSQYILLASIITLLRLDNINIIKRIKKFLVYFSMYYGSYLLVNMININIYGKVLLFAIIAKLINTLITDIYKFKLEVFSVELLFFLTATPSIYFYLMSNNEIIKYYFLFQNLIFLEIYYFITKYIYEKEEETIKNQRLNKFNEIMFEFSNLLYSKTLHFSDKKLFFDVAKFLNEKFEFNYILISKINYNENLIERVAYSGFTEKEFEELKSKEVKASEIINNIFSNVKYKYGEVYFIPNVINKVNSDNYFIIENNVNIDTYSDEDYRWDSKDLLLITLRDKDDNIFAYISCDSPKSGLRPTKEEMLILSVLGRIVSMIVSHKEHYIEMKKLSELDPMTKLYNPSKLNADLEYYENNKKIISLAFIDLDDFKKINDTYGHLKGDEILKEVSNIIKNSIRETDKAYRYGGDEFIIIFENIDKQKAKIIMERIKNNLVEKNITFSVGIVDDSNISIKDLIKKADEKAYIAKKTGKNKIVC